MEVTVPKPKKTDEQKAQFAIEVAFGALTSTAKAQGLPLNPAMGLVYLPTEKLSSNFIQACRDILAALKPAQ